MREIVTDNCWAIENVERHTSEIESVRSKSFGKSVSRGSLKIFQIILKFNEMRKEENISSALLIRAMLCSCVSFILK